MGGTHVDLIKRLLNPMLLLAVGITVPGLRADEPDPVPPPTKQLYIYFGDKAREYDGRRTIRIGTLKSWISTAYPLRISSGCCNPGERRTW